MAKLILSIDGAELRDIPLTKERTTIGRKPHNDVLVDNLVVSGEHAVIVRVAEDYFLEDLGSTNGTLVNGAPVKRHLLKNNDAIELGKYKLVFVGRSPPPAHADADYEKTMVWRPAEAKPMAEQARAIAAGEGAAAPRPAAPPVPASPARAAAAGPHAASSAPNAAPRRGAPSGKPLLSFGLVLLGVLVVAYVAWRMLG